MDIPRAVPRHPGPKYFWSSYLNTTSIGISVIADVSAGGYDYWIETLDVYATTSGGANEEFVCFFQTTAAQGGPQEIFFGAQISPNTGLYFPYRGPIRIPQGSILYLNNLNGGWSAYVAGFLTSVDSGV